MSDRVFQNWRLPESPQNALLRGLQMQRAQQGNALNALNLQAAQQQMAEQAQQRNALEQFRGSLVSPEMQATQAALAPVPGQQRGPTPEALARRQPVDPRAQMLFQAMKAGQIAPMDYLKEAMPAPDFKVVDGGLVQTNAPGGPKMVINSAAKPAALPSSWQEFQLAQQNPEFAAHMERMKRAGAAGGVTLMAPIAVQQPDGTVTYVQPGNKPGAVPQPLMGPDGKPLLKPAGNEKDPTEGERKAATLLMRLQGSQQQLARAVGLNMDANKPGAMQEVVRRIAGDTAANILTPAARQQVEAAQMDILDAALTLGTGAAYTREQLEGYRKAYFPAIGDDAQTIKDKRARLQNVIDAAQIAAGKAAKQVPGNAPTADNSDPLGLRGK